jgi:lipid A 4'-phosphatase
VFAGANFALEMEPLMPQPQIYTPNRFFSLHVHLHLFLGFTIFFLLSPQIDIGFSAVFYDPARGFFLSQIEALRLVRGGLWNLSLAIVLVSLLMLALHPFRRNARHLATRYWGFAAALFLLGPGLLVNVILKGYWGRARPSDIAEFGGTQVYTPPFQIADQCVSNCSFVSGEGAGSAAAAIVIAVFARSALSGRALYLAYGVAALVVVFGAGLRVLFGGHFLSDTVFAVLMMGLLADILHRLILRPQPKAE